MRILQVEYIKDYKLKLHFNDQTIKIVDLENMIKNLGGIFSPLKDISYFKQVMVDDCQLSICWPNGADICPDILYGMGKDQITKRSTSVADHPKRRKRTLKGPCGII